eukprot:5635416-Amphidinium_carterae.1
MQVNPKKTVIVCNGTHTNNKLKRAWRAGHLPPVRITTRDLGVDTHAVGLLEEPSANKTPPHLEPACTDLPRMN